MPISQGFPIKLMDRGGDIFPSPIHGTNGIVMPTWMLDLYGKLVDLVGRYTSPMDPSWDLRCSFLKENLGGSSTSLTKIK